MFEATVAKDRLESFLEPISALTDECRLRLGEDGIAVSAVDGANVAMVDVELGADAFEHYDADGAVIGLPLARFEDIVGMAPSNALVRLELTDASGRLDIAFHRVDYSCALLDTDAIREDPDAPDLELPAEVGIEGGEIVRAVSLAGFVADHVRFGVDEGAATFFADADGDTDDIHIEHVSDELRALTAAEVQSIFSIDYLDDIAATVPKDAAVTLELGDSMPMRLAFEFAEDDGAAEFLLSPRVQGEA